MMWIYFKRSLNVTWKIPWRIHFYLPWIIYSAEKGLNNFNIRIFLMWADYVEINIFNVAPLTFWLFLLQKIKWMKTIWDWIGNFINFHFFPSQNCLHSTWLVLFLYTFFLNFIFIYFIFFLETYTTKIYRFILSIELHLSSYHFKILFHLLPFSHLTSSLSSISIS